MDNEDLEEAGENPPDFILEHDPPPDAIPPDEIKHDPPPDAIPPDEICNNPPPDVTISAPPDPPAGALQLTRYEVLTLAMFGGILVVACSKEFPGWYMYQQKDDAPGNNDNFMQLSEPQNGIEEMQPTVTKDISISDSFERKTSEKILLYKENEEIVLPPKDTIKKLQKIKKSFDIKTENNKKAKEWFNGLRRTPYSDTTSLTPWHMYFIQPADNRLRLLKPTVSLYEQMAEKCYFPDNEYRSDRNYENEFQYEPCAVALENWLEVEKQELQMLDFRSEDESENAIWPSDAKNAKPDPEHFDDRQKRQARLDLNERYIQFNNIERWITNLRTLGSGVKVEETLDGQYKKNVNNYFNLPVQEYRTWD